MERINISINPELLEEIDFYLPQNDCKNRSEFINKGMDFYLSYLRSGKDTEYLNQSVAAGVRAGINDIEKQTMPNLFRLSVELSMMMNIIAAGFDITPNELRTLRTQCAKAVKQTKQRCTLEHAVKFQRDMPLDDPFFSTFPMLNADKENEE